MTATLFGNDLVGSHVDTTRHEVCYESLQIHFIKSNEVISIASDCCRLLCDADDLYLISQYFATCLTDILRPSLDVL